VSVKNFTLKAPGGAKAAGEGHLHYYKDVEIPTAAGKPAVSAPGTYKADPGTTIAWENVTAGTHTFGVQLVNNDHTPLEPPVTATVTVTVQAAATTPPASSVDAKALYTTNCAVCHGQKREGNPALKAPELTPAKLADDTIDAIKTVIAKGEDTMPPWEGKLSAAEIDALANFLKTVAP
jgi:mono/diheme cytochrome c family protein